MEKTLALNKVNRNIFYGKVSCDSGGGGGPFLVVGSKVSTRSLAPECWNTNMVLSPLTL